MTLRSGLSTRRNPEGGPAKRTAARTSGMLAVTILVALLSGGHAFAAKGDMPSVTFCHRDGAAGKPYKVDATTDPAAVLKVAGNGNAVGHAGHEGLPYVLGMDFKAEKWGDIIPAFDYPAFGGEPAGHFAGLNVGVGGTGQAWLDRNCEPPPNLTLFKRVSGGGAAPTAWTLDAAGTTPGASLFAGGVSGVSHEVLAGTYALSESGGPPDYTGSLWNCTNTEVDALTVIIGKSQVADVACTITNTFKPPPTEVTLPTLVATPGTCTAPGTVNATDTASYTWASSGSVDATYYTATKTGDLVLVGVNPQGPFNLSKIASQSVSPQEPCYVPPVVPPVLPPASPVPTDVPMAPTTLAFTGAETVPLGLTGLIVLALGTVMTVAGRRQGRHRARG